MRVFTREIPSDKPIAKWVSDLASDDTRIQEAAEVGLDQAGAPAIAPLLDALARDDVALTERVKGVLTRICGGNWDGLDAVSDDLSDENGHIRFRAVAGRRYIAVARAYGRLIGWKELLAASGQGATIEMRPARTLVARLGDLGDRLHPKDQASMWLALPELPLAEAMALWHALELSRPSLPVEPIGKLNSDGPNTFVAEDLPAGMRGVLQVRNSAGKAIVERKVLVGQEGPRVQNIVIEGD